MGTQKEIAKQIVEQDGDYVLALKGNQGNLFEDVQQIFASTQSQDFKDIDNDYYETLDAGHGRIEKRRYWSLGQVEWLIDAEKWAQFSSIAMVESIRQCDGETSREVRYYISSLAPDAKRLAESIRIHWSMKIPCTGFWMSLSVKMSLVFVLAMPLQISRSLDRLL